MCLTQNPRKLSLGGNLAPAATSIDSSSNFHRPRNQKIRQRCVSLPPGHVTFRLMPACIRNPASPGPCSPKGLPKQCLFFRSCVEPAVCFIRVSNTLLASTTTMEGCLQGKKVRLQLGVPPWSGYISELHVSIVCIPLELCHFLNQGESLTRQYGRNDASKSAGSPGKKLTIAMWLVASSSSVGMQLELFLSLLPRGHSSERNAPALEETRDPLTCSSPKQQH